VSEDEPPKSFQPERLQRLKPVFEEGGSVTAGNASSLADGASALIVMERQAAEKRGLTPLVRIAGYVSSGTAPEWFTIAPADAIEKLLHSCGRRISEIDLFEINEAFSVSSIAVNRRLGIDPERVNIRGGSVALGHPIGASGSRILTTLIYSLRELKKARGIAALCLGGGEAVAMMIETV
jgi:acetyl-CoA C-acetyltransferase